MLGGSAPRLFCLPVTATVKCLPGLTGCPGRRPRPGAAGGLHGSQESSLGAEPRRCPPLPPLSRPRVARLPARWLGSRGSRGSRVRQRERGSSRAQGLAFVALKTFQRACHGDAQRLGRSPRGARLPRGTFRRSAALSLSLSDAPPPGLALPELPPSLPARTFPAPAAPVPVAAAALRSPCPAAAPRLAFQNGPAPSRALRAASAAPSPGQPRSGQGRRGAGEGRRGPAARG